jgi:trigger factor
MADSVTPSHRPAIVNVQANTLSPTRKSIVVTLEPSEVDAEHQAVVGEYIKLARIPGFRPGRAPAAMVTRRFGKEIAEQFKHQVVAKAYRGALEDKELDVLNIVTVDEGTVAQGTAAAITVTVDVRPDFQVPDYVGLPTEVEPTDPTDAEIDSVIQGLRSERADFQTVTRAARKGDYVKLSYEGTVDGKPISEIAPDRQLYAKVPQTWEEIEGEQEGVIPGLGRQLGGLSAGEKKKVAVTFPTDFPPAPVLAGKAAEYAVEIQEVRERVLPALDEAFFKSQQVDDLEGLKTRVRNGLKQQKEFQNRLSQRRQVTEKLAAKVEFPVPDSLVEAETQAVLRQFIEDNMRRGVAAEQFEKDKQALFASAKQAAVQRVKVQLLLSKVAVAEKIETTEKDIDEFIYREAQRNRQAPDKVAKELARNREALRSAQQSIIFDKAVDFLVSKASVTVVPPKPAPTTA